MNKDFVEVANDSGTNNGSLMLFVNKIVEMKDLLF